MEDLGCVISIRAFKSRVHVPSGTATTTNVTEMIRILRKAIAFVLGVLREEAVSTFTTEENKVKPVWIGL
jgi:hypothetical protein